MHYADRLFAQDGVTIELEVRAIGQYRVPVLAGSGLPDNPILAAAVASQARATMQLNNSRPATLSCGIDDASYVCRPVGAEAAAIARALPDAGSITIRLLGALPGEKLEPLGHRTLVLSGTVQALTHLPESGPLPHGLEPQSIPPGWLRLGDQALRSMGYPDGAASLKALVSKYLQR